MSNAIHDVSTRKRRYRYQFTAKHHGRCKKGDACWLKQLTRAEEFSVFDEAEYHDIFDEREWFYGVLPDAN